MLISYKAVFIAAAIGVLPVFIWVWFLLKSHTFSFGSSNFILKVFFWGVLTAVPASVFEIIVIETQGGGQIIQTMQAIWNVQKTNIAFTVLVSTTLMAAIEELSKGIGIGLAVLLKKVRSSNDGMVIGVLIGLAFGVTENGVYFASAMGTQRGSDFLTIVLLRFILSTSAHIIYSSTMGTFLAEAFLSKNLSSKFLKIVLAFLLPVGIHSVFNLILNTAFSWLASIVILVGFVLLWMRYKGVARKEEQQRQELVTQ
ncbi:MAG: PrsW family glutamic-type intramembrane protease [Patescibacteria group bacterium]|nr:PrsW family glutamic-type intramembrane protease [Patescibacteria group bacterium]